MNGVSLKELTALFNQSWPQHWKAEYGVEGFGKFTLFAPKELDAASFSVNREQMKIEMVRPRNTECIANVIIYRGTYPNFDEDFYTVEIRTHFGRLLSVDQHQVDKLYLYINQRKNDIKKYLDNFDDQYPVEWNQYILIKVAENYTEYNLTGHAVIPFDVIGEGKDIVDLDELNKILLEGFYLAEHPNDIDTYLELNKEGLIHDTWTKSVES